MTHPTAIAATLVAQRPSLTMRLASAALGRRGRHKEGTPADLDADRRLLRRLTSLARAPRGVQLTEEVIAGVPVLRASSGARARGTVLYLHGGAYVAGRARDGVTAAHISADEGPDLVSIEYRCAPEHPYPAAVEDALAVYRELVRAPGPDRLVVVGESAGGGLALVLLQKAREEGLPMPAAVVPIFPWVDLSLSGASSTANIGRDMLTRSQLLEAAAWYACGRDLRDPGLSPLFGSFRGFPRTYVPVGQHDLLLDDARRLVARMRAEDVQVDFDEWPGTIHGFVRVPSAEGRQCRRRVQAVVHEALPAAPPGAGPECS
ncbi:alpha/beta hydrolase [Streptomyces sp. WI04-05B]|uniref:alpha/beta hydrolase n=1 Tax=Streptomyces TaxID=1883 RepID=UPI0029BC61CD|nr:MULTISPECIES: alpha/beta hydrolase [unclassified Streptomyces]MDX2546841.1 alpha/beta hydrolase [Streptomyces sp. WI04-05B]MDX2589637.1 alpha/beta hydrolase [Streptomyces sp. WI04-05A]